jgi:hypothetical protein
MSLTFFYSVGSVRAGGTDVHHSTNGIWLDKTLLQLSWARRCVVPALYGISATVVYPRETIYPKHRNDELGRGFCSICGLWLTQFKPPSYHYSTPYQINIHALKQMYVLLIQLHRTQVEYICILIYSTVDSILHLCICALFYLQRQLFYTVYILYLYV